MGIGYFIICFQMWEHQWEFSWEPMADIRFFFVLKGNLGRTYAQLHNCLIFHGFTLTFVGLPEGELLTWGNTAGFSLD